MTQELPRILVGVDFSPSSDRAVEEARRLAHQMGAQLDFVHIYALPPSSGELAGRPVDGKAIEAAREALDALEHTARGEGFVATAHLGVGGAVHGVLDFVRRLKPALVVVGSHGRGAVMRLLVGSVAESLIRRSPAPVLVVPAPERVAHNDTARSCRACGHMLTHFESTSRCAQCGSDSPDWISATLSAEPIDAGLPSVGEETRDEGSSAQRNSAGLFATSPGGTEGYDVNPELRVRY